METTYYDTPGLALSGRRYTLRRRLENGRSVCTLKTPAGEARNEWETENVFIENAIEDLIAQGAPAELRQFAKDGLFPICGAKFTRLAKTIRLENAEVELALDQGYLTGGGIDLPLCEVEVELKHGYRQEVEIMGLLLKEAYGLTAENRSKYQRSRELGAK